MPSQPADGLALPADAESLALQLQSLPQGGKLLPLLQQVLDSAENAGVDTSQLMDRIAARLEQLQAGGELNPADDIAVVLQQLLVAIPDSRTVAESQAAMLAAVDGKTLQQDGAAGQGNRAQQPYVDGRSALVAAGDSALAEEAGSELKNTGLDRALAQIRQQDTGQRYHTRLASMIAVLKRDNPDTSRITDTLLRTDSTGSTVAPPAAVQSASSGPAPAVPTLTLGTPLNQGGWDQALGERIQWMAGQKLQGAQIKLNPAHLGPMEVRIQVQNEQASIQFVSAHGVVREALEAALPRLREIFDASGVELVDVDVSGQSFAEQQRSAGEGKATAWQGEGEATEQDAGLETVLDIPLGGFLESGRLDLFA
ncbi:MAG: flagellar hook-length control protein FliK [Thiogranum sp.]